MRICLLLHQIDRIFSIGTSLIVENPDIGLQRAITVTIAVVNGPAEIPRNSLQAHLPYSQVKCIRFPDSNFTKMRTRLLAIRDNRFHKNYATSPRIGSIRWRLGRTQPSGYSLRYLTIPYKTPYIAFGIESCLTMSSSNYSSMKTQVIFMFGAFD